MKTSIILAALAATALVPASAPGGPEDFPIPALPGCTTVAAWEDGSALATCVNGLIVMAYDPDEHCSG